MDITSLLFGDSPGGNLAQQLDGMLADDQMISDTWERIYTLISFLYPYSTAGKV
jgi:hypothetical protein